MSIFLLAEHLELHCVHRPTRTGAAGINLILAVIDVVCFYYGFCRLSKTAFVVPKNSMDADFFKVPKTLQVILSGVFDKHRLNVEPGKRLKMSLHQGLDPPEFKAWFGESKIVDGEGQPLVMFHGRSRRESLEGMDVFPTNGYKGAYFTSKPDYASGYAIEFRAEKPSGNFEPNDQTGSVYKVYLSIKNPLYIDAKDASKVDDYQHYGQDLYPERLLAQGYDGVVLDWGNGDVEATVFSSTQIKSVFNTGTGDACDPTIIHEES